MGLERVSSCYTVSASDGLLRPFLLEILACIIGLSKGFWAQTDFSEDTKHIYSVEMWTT